MEIKRDILWRVYLSFLGVLGLSLLIIGKAVYIQRFQGSYWKSLSDSLHLEYRELDADRGTIYSEDGSMLSTSVPFFDIHVDFGADGLRENEGKRFKENLDSLSIGLSGIFGDESPSKYRKELLAGFKTNDRYYLLHRKVSFEQYQLLKNLPLLRLGRNKSGFIIEDREKRLTPFGLLANRTIGLAREYQDSNGSTVRKNVGLEKTYDSLLRGVSGKRLVRRIAGGAFVPIEGSEIEPENGKDVITTLDVNVQDIAETALMRMMIQNEALEGCVVVMDVETGKIKGMANLGLMPDGTYFEKDNYALKTSEPGSTIKLVTLLSVLEDKYAKISDMVEINGGEWYLNGRRIVDAERSPKNLLTVKEAFEHSSNVGMSKLAYYNYNKNPAQFIGHFESLKLTTRSGIDLNEEFRPLVKNPGRKDWHYQTLPSMGFGYEVMLSPVQLLMVYNAVANNGKLMKPYLVNRIEKDGIIQKQFLPVVLNEKICSESTLQQLKECLIAVCQDGTAKLAFKDVPYSVAGKTGTAEVNDGKFKYDDGVYQSAFAGYFPVEKPRYSCIVVIKNKPHAIKHFGGDVAAPVFREIADKLYSLNPDDQKRFMTSSGTDSSKYWWSGYEQDLKYVLTKMNMPVIDSAEGRDWSYVFTSQRAEVIKGMNFSRQSVPNVVGMGLKDALYLLENLKLRVAVKGKGKITGQSLAAGSAFNNGQLINLVLN